MKDNRTGEDLTADWRRRVAGLAPAEAAWHAAARAALEAAGWRPDTAAYLAYERLEQERARVLALPLLSPRCARSGNDG